MLKQFFKKYKKTADIYKAVGFIGIIGIIVGFAIRKQLAS